MPEKLRFACMADVEEIETVHYSERVKENSTLELILQGAAVNPEGVAISFLLNGDDFRQPQQITYAQLIGRIRQTANMLHELGVGPTDVVSYLLPNLPQTHFVLWGAEAAGIANPINPLLESGTIRDICLAADTKVLVALGECPGVDIWSKVEAIRRELPSLKAVIRVMGPSDKIQGIYGYEAEIDRFPGDRLAFERTIQKDDIASLYHTGGTTGRPKLAKRTHLNEIVLAHGLAIVTGVQPDESVLCGLPLFHCNGTCVTGLMPFLVGSEVVLLSPRGYRDPSIMKNFWKIVETYRAAFFSCVPTILGMLLDVPIGDADISSLKFTVCGAAPLSVELFNRFEEYSGLKILEGYGLTETACASAANPKDGERRVGSIGLRLPYHWIKVAILDEHGRFIRDADIDEIGVLCVKGPCVFKGYVEPIHNIGIWIDEKQEWFNTGDLGRQDKDGYLWLTGRRKELIIRGGHNIDPAVIEEALYQKEGVRGAAAVGRPDAYAGEVPVAYVEVTDPDRVKADELMEWAKSHIGERAAIPKEVIITDQIPLTAVGKIFKPALKWDAIKRTYERELTALGDLADFIDVEVGEDPIHGALANIRVKAAAGVDRRSIETKIQEILSRFLVKYKVKVS